MEPKKLMEVVNDVENKSNKVLMESLNELNDEFNKTKDLIVDLTRHLDTMEDMYNKLYNEFKKRRKI